MEVEFSELALAGLNKLDLSAAQKDSIRLAIPYFLKANDAERRARALPAFADKEIYLFPIYRTRVVYELIRNPRKVLVWSIKPAADA